MLNSTSGCYNIQEKCHNLINILLSRRHLTFNISAYAYFFIYKGFSLQSMYSRKPYLLCYILQFLDRICCDWRRTWLSLWLYHTPYSHHSQDSHGLWWPRSTVGCPRIQLQIHAAYGRHTPDSSQPAK